MTDSECNVLIDDGLGQDRNCLMRGILSMRFLLIVILIVGSVIPTFVTWQIVTKAADTSIDDLNDYAVVAVDGILRHSHFEYFTLELFNWFDQVHLSAKLLRAQLENINSTAPQDLLQVKLPSAIHVSVAPAIQGGSGGCAFVTTSGYYFYVGTIEDGDGIRTNFTYTIYHNLNAGYILHAKRGAVYLADIPTLETTTDFTGPGVVPTAYNGTTSQAWYPIAAAVPAGRFRFSVPELDSHNFIRAFYMFSFRGADGVGPVVGAGRVMVPFARMNSWLQSISLAGEIFFVVDRTSGLFICSSHISGTLGVVTTNTSGVLKNTTKTIGPFSSTFAPIRLVGAYLQSASWPETSFTVEDNGTTYSIDTNILLQPNTLLDGVDWLMVQVYNTLPLAPSAANSSTDSSFLTHAKIINAAVEDRIMVEQKHNSVKDDVSDTKKKTVIFAIIVVVVFIILGALVMIAVLHPLNKMQIAFRKTATFQLKQTSDSLPKAFLTEIVDLRTSFVAMLRSLREYRTYLPQTVAADTEEHLQPRSPTAKKNTVNPVEMETKQWSAEIFGLSQPSPAVGIVNRIATVMVCSLDSVANLIMAASQDNDDLSKGLASFYDAVHTSVLASNGTIISALANKVVCVFASKQPINDAASAARQIRALLHSSACHTTITLAHGRCIVGNVGSSSFRCSNVFGTPLEVAEKLQSALPADEEVGIWARNAILVPSEVANQLDRNYHSVAIGVHQKEVLYALLDTAIPVDTSRALELAAKNLAAGKLDAAERALPPDMLNQGPFAAHMRQVIARCKAEQSLSTSSNV